MFRTTRSFAIALLITTAACVPTTPEVTSTRIVDASFAGGSSWWTNGGSLRFALAYTVVASGDRTLVCGAYGYSSATLATPTQNMLRQGAIIADGRPVLSDLSFFSRKNRVRARDDLNGAPANCAHTNEPIRRSQTISIELGDGSFKG